MTTNHRNFEDLLAIRNLAELRAGVARGEMALAPPQVHRIIAHAQSLQTVTYGLRLGIVHTYTSELLDPWLELAAALQGLKLETYHAPYGLTLQEAQTNSGLLRHQPDLTLLLVRREDLHPDLSKPLVGLSSAHREELAKEALDRLYETVGQFRMHEVGQIILTLLPAFLSPALGAYDAQFGHSESKWWADLKADVAERLRSLPAVCFIDLDEIALQIGREGLFDRRFWYSARYPFSPRGAAEIARRVVGLGVLLKVPKAKVIVLDADNTLWGGIVGEDGIKGIALGTDFPGNAFADFQRRLLDFRERGFLLALCSKNNPGDVEQILQEHPHQILRSEHFAAQRINWLPKPENLISLSEELKLGLDSFVVVDDSDYECAAIRQELPQVEVVQTPARPAEMPQCLEQVARLEVLTLTTEDRGKTELYRQERQRHALQQNHKATGAPLHDFLVSLKMKMRVGFNDLTCLPRLTQLTQKTNQFNLTTRRYNEQQMQAFILDSSWLVAHFSLADAFGDSGVVGLAIVHIPTPQQAELDTFLMSCRVIGRELESAFLHALLRRLTDQGINEVVACYRPTAKNELARNFLPDQGFEKCTEGRYRRDLRAASALPESAFPVVIELAN